MKTPTTRRPKASATKTTRAKTTRKPRAAKPNSAFVAKAPRAEATGESTFAAARPAEATGDSNHDIALAPPHRPQLVGETDEFRTMVDGLKYATGGMSQPTGDAIPALLTGASYVLPLSVAARMSAAEAAPIIEIEPPIQMGQQGTLAPVLPPIAPIIFEPLAEPTQFAPALTPEGVNHVETRLLAIVEPAKAQALRTALKAFTVTAARDGAEVPGITVIAYGERVPSAAVGSPRYAGLFCQQFHPGMSKTLNPDAWQRWYESLRVLTRGPVVVF